MYREWILELSFTYFVSLIFMQANEMDYLFELESKVCNNLTYENKKDSKQISYFSVNKYTSVYLVTNVIKN